MADENTQAQTDEQAEATETVEFGGLQFEKVTAKARGRRDEGEEPREFTFQALGPNSINRDDPGEAFAEALQAVEDDLNRFAACFIKGYNSLARSDAESGDEYLKTAKDILRQGQSSNWSKWTKYRGMSLEDIAAKVKEFYDAQ